MAKSTVFIDGIQAGSTLQQLRKDVAKLTFEHGKAAAGSKEYNRTFNELKAKSGQLTQHRNAIKGLGAAHNQANTGMLSMMRQFAPMAAAGLVIGKTFRGIGNAVGSWVDNNMRLERSLDTLQSLTNANAKDVAFYKDEAIRMGRETTQSATQVVDAMKMIGSQKPELLGNRDALAAVTEEVIVLAEAAEINLEEAAKAVTGTLNQFNKGAEETKSLVNSFAAGSQAGAAGIASIGESMDKSGAVMHGYNVKVESGIGLIETLAEKNIVGAEAGTKLRNILLSMETVEALPQSVLDRLSAAGVSVENVADKSLPFNERLKEMSKIGGDTNLMLDVFKKQNVVAAKAILENTDKVEHFTNAVTGTNTAYQQQAINNDNMVGDLKSLGSAWEGLTLTVGGASEMFRPIIQAGTDFLNWTTDSIKAIKEWDVRDMQIQIVKLARSLPFVTGALKDLFDQAVRTAELTNEVADAMRPAAEAAAVMTMAVDENNKALKSGNLTAEERGEIEEQNAQIIGTLNEAYPELTENLDLNAASSEELSKLQKEINANLLDQAVNAAKAAEMERILNKIVTTSINQAMMRRKAQSDNLNFLQKKFADSFEKSSKSTIKKSKQQLKDLGKTFDDIKKTLSAENIEFGIGYEANADMAKAANKELQKLEKELANTRNTNLKKAVEAQIQAQKKIISLAKGSKEEMIAAAIEVTKADDDRAEAEKKNEQKAAAASKKAIARYKKMRSELKKLKELLEDLNEDFDFNRRLEAFEDEQDKELFAAEHTIDKKFEKEIDSAQKLAKGKGKIAEEAQEVLDGLLILREKEVQISRNKIIKEWAKKSADEQYDIFVENNLRFLEQQRTLGEAINAIQLAQAMIGVEDAKDLDIHAQKEARKRLEEALVEDAEFKNKAEISRLGDLEAELKISREEFNVRKEQLELEHTQRLKEIHQSSNEEINQLSQQRLEQTFDILTQALDFADELSDKRTKAQIDRIDRQEKAELDRLEKSKEQKLITEDEYNEQKTAIEAGADQKRKELELEQARREREIALFKIAINTAAEVAKVAAAPPLVVLALATGAAQAALVLATPLPQLMDGGFSDVVGAQDGKSYRAKRIGKPTGGLIPSGPSLALVNEKGPEYFVPNGLLRDQRVANHVGAIEAIRTHQFAAGGLTSGVISAGGVDDEVKMILKMSYKVMSTMVVQLQNIGVTIGDEQLDDMNERNAELNKMRA